MSLIDRARPPHSKDDALPRQGTENHRLLPRGEGAPVALGVPPAALAWRMLVVLVGAVAIGSMGRYALGPLSPFIIEHYGLSKGEFGVLSSAIGLGAIITSYASGVLIDRLGVRQVARLALLGIGIPLTLFFFPVGYGAAAVLLLLSGAGFSSISPLASNGTANWFPPRARGLTVGITQAGIPLGVALAGLVLPRLAIAAGWGVALGILGVVVASAGLLLSWIYQDGPLPAAGRGQTANPGRAAAKSPNPGHEQAAAQRPADGQERAPGQRPADEQEGAAAQRPADRHEWAAEHKPADGQERAPGQRPADEQEGAAAQRPADGHEWAAAEKRAEGNQQATGLGQASRQTGAAGQGQIVAAGSAGPAIRVSPWSLLREGNNVWLFTLGLVLAMTQNSVIAFLVPFIQDRWELPVVTAGALLSVSQLAGMGARPVIGYVSDRFLDGRRKGLLMGIASLACGALAVLAVSPSTLPTAVIALLMVVVGLTTLGWSGLFFALNLERARPGTGGAASGMAVGVVMIGSLAGPALYGYLVDVMSFAAGWLALAAAVGAATALFVWRFPERTDGFQV